MAAKRSYPRSQAFLISIQICGDLIVSFAGLGLGYFLRFRTGLRTIGIESGSIDLLTYLPILAFGALLLVGSFAYLRLYDARLLLRPHRSLNIVLRGTFFWFLIFLSISLIMKFVPPISRLFVATSCLTTFAAMVGWRTSFYIVLSRSKWRQRIMQRIVLIGWSDEAESLALAIAQDKNHPYEIFGVITTPATEKATRGRETILGPVSAIETILTENLVDSIVVADLDLSRDELLDIASAAERLYVDFKVIPSFFQVFVSNLRMQTISGVPLLGVERIPLKGPVNQFGKRCTDVVGAAVGLFISAPIILVLGWLVRRESPGPTIFKQTRVGLDGRPFTIYKLRSMRLDAETTSGPKWAVADDPRRLKVGAFMREWNLDELPQFWNVFVGNMSLVGPRPERPELIAQFEREIPHYNPRHEVRPGLTGWAQVNGLRGNTSLKERIRYDLYYIENWSFWFDIQIMLLTFVRRSNAY